MTEAIVNAPLHHSLHLPSCDALSANLQRNLQQDLKRTGEITVSTAIDLYMAAYSGRDTTRASRMLYWKTILGNLKLNEVNSDHIFFATEELATKQARYWAGKDADGKPIFKSKGKPYAPATLNRYVANIGALFTWCIRKRLTPQKWDHPCRGIERRPENNEIIRFLSESERTALLFVCAQSKWPKLYLLVLMALTTGARRGELLRLTWDDIDFTRCVAYVGHTKNGDRKTLPLVPPVVAELKRHKAIGNALVFASRKCPNQAFNFVPSWSVALKTAKIRNFRFHDLRHSCASHLAQNGATLLEISDVLGHRQISVTKRYSHLTTGHKSNLINRHFAGIQ
jgi:integrase